MLTILFLFGYQALKSFSGYDPLKIDPKTLSNSLFSNELLYKITTKALSFDPTHTLAKFTKNSPISPNSQNAPTPTGAMSFRFAVVTDSHNDNNNLQKALEQAKQADAKFVIGLGDYSDVGTLEELQAAKAVFDASGLPFYSTAGDHDLWDSRNRKLESLTNYSHTFGSPYTSFGYQEVRFVILFDSDNYLGIDENQKKWIEQELQRTGESSKLTFVLTGIPLYHPSSDHIYGKVDSKLKTQAEDLINLLQKYKVTELIAGDTHFYTSYVEPKTNLHMTTVGAITSTRNAQSPRFALVDVYESGAYTIQDTEIKNP